MCFAKVFDQSQLVILPILGQLACRWIFATTQFQSSFHTPVPDVVIILHASRQWVPCSSIGDATREGGASGLTRHASAHLQMIGRISQGQMTEDIIVRCQ